MDQERLKRIHRASVSVAWAYAEKLTADQSFAKALERLRSELAPRPHEETKDE